MKSISTGLEIERLISGGTFSLIKLSISRPVTINFNVILCHSVWFHRERLPAQRCPYSHLYTAKFRRHYKVPALTSSALLYSSCSLNSTSRTLHLFTHNRCANVYNLMWFRRRNFILISYSFAYSFFKTLIWHL